MHFKSSWLFVLILGSCDDLFASLCSFAGDGCFRSLFYS